MNHFDENIWIVYAFVVTTAVGLFFLVMYLGRADKKAPDPLLQQILEDAEWDFWIENEARKVLAIFEEKKTVSYKIVLPKDYTIHHKSGKYVYVSITECVFKRYEELKDGEGRKLILS